MRSVTHHRLIWAGRLDNTCVREFVLDESERLLFTNSRDPGIDMTTAIAYRAIE